MPIDRCRFVDFRTGLALVVIVGIIVVRDVRIVIVIVVIIDGGRVVVVRIAVFAFLIIIIIVVVVVVFRVELSGARARRVGRSGSARIRPYHFIIYFLVWSVYQSTWFVCE